MARSTRSQDGNPSVWKRLTYVLLLLPLATAIGLAVYFATRRGSKNGPVSLNLFIFGDSYTTTGYNVSLQPQPSLEHPLGNPKFPGTTLCGQNCSNWIDVVVQESSLPNLLAYDFAVGGATVNSSLIMANSTLANMIQQVEAFKSLSPEIEWSSRNGLFVSWFGINNVWRMILQGYEMEHARDILEPDAGDYFDLLDHLYQLGARNFISMGMPPIYRAPLWNFGKSPDAGDVKNLAEYWNDLIHSGNDRFQEGHSGTTAIVFDPTSTFNDILDHPWEYGAPNATCWSWPQGEPCLWTDFIHVGKIIQRKLGSTMAEEILETFLH